jgi:hypothetical protein
MPPPTPIRPTVPDIIDITSEIPALPIKFSPQVLRNSAVLRSIARQGPMPSAARIGTTRKVAAVQASPSVASRLIDVRRYPVARPAMRRAYVLHKPTCPSTARRAVLGSLTASTGVRCQWGRRCLLFTITGRVVHPKPGRSQMDIPKHQEQSVDCCIVA